MNIANHSRIDTFSGAQMIAAGPVSGLDAFSRDVREVLRVLWRRKTWIVAITALFLIGAMLFVLFSTPLYRASAELLIDPRSKRVLQTEQVVPGGLGTSSQGADSLLVDSQVEIIASDAVLRRVVTSQGLDQDAEFTKPVSPGLRAKLLDLLGEGDAAGSRIAQDPTELALYHLRKALYVKRVGNTYIIEIYMLLPDPRQAAAIANAVAEAYLAEEAHASSSSTRETTESLAARIAELRTDVERAESRVEDYRKAHDLVGTQGTLINEQQLADMNQRLGAARAQVEAAQARFAQAKLLVGAGPSAALAAEGLDSPTLAALRTNLAEIDRRRAELSAVFGPDHPQMKTIEAQRAVAQGQLSAELSLVVQRTRNELELARANEASLARELDKLKATTLANNEAQIKLRELQRDADTSRALLENVLARVKQSSEQEALSTSNFRILTRATTPMRIAYPPTLIVLLGALCAGLAIGALFAWLLEHFATRAASPERSVA
ncbi:GumC family protein [Rhodoligotrophos defluvii]|uniref:GumC family protein n=1 Tax=Rhodoligotrophos defluvii TaxID=2561934 RepID=UPI0010C9AF70|nr:GumC family protein [Rhodoligotrophos defluvii]